MSLTVEEHQVVAAVVARRDDLVQLAADLVRHDTNTHVAGAPAREERMLQELIAARLRASGAEIDLWEPDPETLAGHPYVPAGFSFAGRPQLAARFAGVGGGRSLLLCGHVDVVSAGALADWASPPFSPQIRDGSLYGRGSCDMKGGVAAMIIAAETLAELGVQLAGDLIVSTVTEEESTGAGGLALVRRGWRADAALVPEPTGLDVAIACRGSLCPSLHVEGRAGHAGLPARHPSVGGAVNAIEKTMYLLDGLRRLREEWALSTAHRYLAPADIVPTIISGGDWIVSHAASCTVDLHVEYLPGQADEAGRGSLVQAEISAWIARLAAADSWLATHPPRIEWPTGDVPPAEMPSDHPLARATLGAALDLGSASRLAGFQNWHDGATLSVEAGIPSLCFGPGDIGLAHAVDEHVPLDELLACAQAIAVAAMRFCAAATDQARA